MHAKPQGRPGAAASTAFECPLSEAIWKPFVQSEPYRLCAGFRMPAMYDLATRIRAGVRKPPKNEPAGDGARKAPSALLWGFGGWGGRVPSNVVSFATVADVAGRQ